MDLCQHVTGSPRALFEPNVNAATAMFVGTVVWAIILFVIALSFPPIGALVAAVLALLDAFTIMLSSFLGDGWSICAR